MAQTRIPTIDATSNVTETTDLPLGLASVTVTLTDAQIKALPTAAVELVAAPGANKLLRVISALAQLDATAGAYATVTDAAWNLMWANQMASATVLAEQRLVEAAITTIPFLVPVEPVLGSGTFAGMIVTGPMGDVANTALSLRDSWASADYTGGHANNTLTVTVLYCVVPV